MQVRMKDLRTDDEALKEVDLPVDSLVDELRKMGITPSGIWTVGSWPEVATQEQWDLLE